MMGWNGWGGGMFGGHLLWWILLVIGLAVLVGWLVAGSRGRPADSSALSILEGRYARGEIDKEEFEARKRDLE